MERPQCVQAPGGRLPLWIIEYVWAHRIMMHLPGEVDSSDWPDVDSAPLSLGDSWRLRVSSAHIYSILKNRDMGRFERVMGVLETTHRLLPTVGSAIKHMKIMFGLKTMVIMWMLREGRAMVDTVSKINQFFPSKLPQYQSQCSQHEMFLMRKNHQDFKALAQSLAMDKNKLKDYMKNHMEEEYGEQYAQKVEDRLLHYLHKLETVLPGDTYIDKILRKESPLTEEEKLLLEVVTSDCSNIATTLKNLLHCDAASCRQSSSEHGQKTVESSRLSKPVLCRSSSENLVKSVETKSPPEVQPVSFIAREGTDCGSNVKRHQPPEEDVEETRRLKEQNKTGEEVGQRTKVRRSSASPQFCSKHQRWVKSILQQCPDDCSEELLLQTNASSSPLLFQSFSSTSTSEDLTPSDLIPSPADEPHPHTPLCPAVAQASRQAKAKDKLRSRSPGSVKDTETEPLCQLTWSKDSPLLALMSPVVQLRDNASVRGIYSDFKLHQTSPNHLTESYNKQQSSAFCNQVLKSSENNIIHWGVKKVEESVFDQQEMAALTDPQESYNNTSYRAATTSTQVPHKFLPNSLAEQVKKAPTSFVTSCLVLPKNTNVSGHLTRDASTSTSQSGALPSVCSAYKIPVSTVSTGTLVHHNSTKSHSHNISPEPVLRSRTPPCSSIVPSTSNFNCPAIRSKTSGSRLRLSLPSQCVLLQSKVLQPFVRLTRMSPHECYRQTQGRSSTMDVSPVVQGSKHNVSEEEGVDSSFDPNALYSSCSSGNNDESIDCDPDYKPCIKKKRLVWEYESARCLDYI